MYTTHRKVEVRSLTCHVRGHQYPYSPAAELLKCVLTLVLRAATVQHTYDLYVYSIDIHKYRNNNALFYIVHRRVSEHVSANTHKNIHELNKA